MAADCSTTLPGREIPAIFAMSNPPAVNLYSMWGNTLGWSISLALVVLTTVSVAWLDRATRTISAQTQFSLDEKNGAAIELPISPSTVLPRMTDPTDAGPIHRRAIDQFHNDPTSYGRFARSGTSADEIESLPAIKILVEATNCASADLFASKPAQIVNLNGDKPDLEALQTLGAASRRAGQLLEKSRPAEALKLYEATFSLGVKLYRERLTYAELDAGLTMMAEGSTMIGLLDPSRSEACQRFNQARKEYVAQRILPTQRLISSADQTMIDDHAGDVFYFSRHARDRMWRIEAIFSTARYRFNAGRVADQRAAARILREILSNDSDPVIQTACSAGLSLTVEQYRTLK
jgi:hypothetical protein